MIIYISGGLLLIIFILLIIAGRETVPEKIDSSKVTAPFYKAGVFLYKRIFEDRERQSAYFQKIYDAKSVLNPSGKTGEEVALFFIVKVSLCILVIFIGNIIVLGSSVMNSQSQYLEEGNHIKRGDYGDREFTVVLDALVNDQILADIPIEVASRKYTTSELEQMLPAFYEEFEKEFLGNNESLDFVNKSVCFVPDIKGYPFSIEYKWDRKDVIDRDGNISDGIDENGNLVSLEASLSYQDFVYKYSFALNVFPKEKEWEQYFMEELQKVITDIQDSTENDEYYTLPSTVNGIEVKWSEKKQNNAWIFLILIVAGAIAVFVGQDKDLYKKLEERTVQMNEDYPEIVSKITLLAGAGMTIRGAWKKIAMEYKEKRDTGMKPRYAYEEMLFTLYEMESGVEETVCYSHFSMRARIQKYVKLVSLLDQNLKIGSKGLITNLKNEAREAFEERKNQAEKKGEEAGTKLLLPMALMLLVVMVIIMFPAFTSM